MRRKSYYITAQLVRPHVGSPKFPVTFDEQLGVDGYPGVWTFKTQDCCGTIRRQHFKSLLSSFWRPHGFKALVDSLREHFIKLLSKTPGRKQGMGCAESFGSFQLFWMKIDSRSEERRVGKEGTCRASTGH